MRGAFIEGDRRLLPFGVDVGAVFRRRVLVDDSPCIGIDPRLRQRNEAVEDSRINGVALVEPLGKGREHVRRLPEHLASFRGRQAGRIFEEDRHEIGKLASFEEEAALHILLAEIDHRLAPLPTVAVDVLEQVQGQ